MADFNLDKKYNYNWQNSKFKDLAFSGSYISQFINDVGYVTSSTAVSASYAATASYLLGSIVSASYAVTSSYAIYAETASFSNRTTQIDVYVKNQSGYNIAKGVVVRITGSNNSSDIPRIVTASYINDGSSANTLGITTQAITNGSEGYVITEGVLTGIDTNAFISGQLIYLGATGSIIGTAPVAPLHAVRLGEVIRHQSNNGSIYVRIDNGYELEELHDVLITSASSGNLLVRSGSVWINSRQLTGSYGLTGSLNATSFTGSLTGSVTNYETAWTSYTPVWTTDGVTQPVIGDGSITGAYKQIGKTVFVRVRLYYGTTTTSGTGTFYFSLPVTSSTTWGIQMPVSMLDNGNAWYQATANGEYGGFTTKTALIGQSAGGANSSQGVTGTFPFTFGNLDSIQFNGTYESA